MFLIKVTTVLFFFSSSKLYTLPPYLKLIGTTWGTYTENFLLVSANARFYCFMQLTQRTSIVVAV